MLKDKKLIIITSWISVLIHLGLITFVAIPLPGTGVWSGSLAAALLDMRFKWAFPAILVGNLIAAIVVMSLSNGVVRVFS